MGGRGRGKTTRRARQHAPEDTLPATPERDTTPPRAKARKPTVADNANKINLMQTQLFKMNDILTGISEKFLDAEAERDNHETPGHRVGGWPHHAPAQTPRHHSDAGPYQDTDRHRTWQPSPSAPHHSTRRVPRQAAAWPAAHDAPTTLREIQENPDLQGQVANFLSATLGPHANNGKKQYAHSYILKGPKKNKATLGELTLPEYNLGFIRLMNSTQVDPSDRHCMLMHLECINEDAARYSWPDVRFWSEEVVHKIAEGTLTWDDEYRIDILRLSLSQQSRIGSQGNTQEDPHQSDTLTLSDIPDEVKSAKPAPPCRHFNAGNCTSKSHHVVNGYRYLHICGYCIYNKCAYLPHPEGTCRSKEYKKQKAARKDAQPAGFGK